MRLITIIFLVAGVSACASIPMSDPSEYQYLSAEKIADVEPGDIRIQGLHGFMLNTYWTAITPNGRYGCMRDLTGEPFCTRRR